MVTVTDSDHSAGGSEHAVRVTALHEYGTWIYPKNVKNGREPNKDLDFREEQKLVFECDCGDRFRKWETAFDHLREEL